MDRLVVCGAQADSQVGDSSGHPVSSGGDVTSGCQSASRKLGSRSEHVAIHEWVHKAELQPVSTVTEDQIAVDEKVIRINGDDHWLYGAIDPKRTKSST